MDPPAFAQPTHNDALAHGAPGSVLCGTSYLVGAQ